MTLNIDPKYVSKFTRELQEAYDDQSILQEICTVFDLDEIGADQERELGFYQVGRRTQFPLKVVETGITRHNAGTIAKEIANGEKRFLLDWINEAAEEDRIESTEIENELTISDLISVYRESSGADRIMLPIIDEYWDALHNWDEFSYESDLDESEGQIEFGTAKIGVHWLPTELGITDIFMINSDEVEVVQKLFGESNPPEGIDPTSKYNDYIDKHPFMVYFGDEVIHDEDDEDFPRKIDLVYRVIISEPQFGRQSAAHRLVSPPELEPDTGDK